MANESKIPVGTVLVDKYRVVREIGRGGMAAVYEAEQLAIGKKVAVKVLASELAASTIVIERFFREARAAASVSSPYIVDVYDSGRLEDGRPFIAMEMLEGESLYDRMARVRVIDAETTIRCIVHTAKGLMKAHAAGIVHRDLKPENIFLTKNDEGEDICKILDFGLAKFYAPMNPEDKAQKRLTREGAVFGTPAYMSPEQVKGQGNVDHRADLWALGCMAYECLIGRPVWNMDQGVAMTFAAIATAPIPVPSHVRADLPPALDAWFLKCLERDPARRYQTAKELADAFVEVWGAPRPSQGSYPNVSSHRYGAAAPGFRPGDPPPADIYETGRLPRNPPSSGVGDRLSPLVPDSFPGSSRVSSPSPYSQRAIDSGPGSTPMPVTSPIRVALSAFFLAGGIAAAGFVWGRFLGPQVRTPVVLSMATATASAVPSGRPGLSVPTTPEPKWALAVAEGQRLFTAGDLSGAQKKFKEASDLGGSVAAKVFLEQTKLASQSTGPCKPVAFSRPRLQSDRRAERPSIVATTKGALVAWTDDHEQVGHDHVYSVSIDPTGRPGGAIRDLTPEAVEAWRPQLVANGVDRSVLLYWDAKGKEAAVRIRALDGEGRIDTTKGQSVRVHAAPRPGAYWPAIEKAPQGFFVVWQDDRDREGETDLFVRRLTFDLETSGPESRLTDYVAPPKSKTGPPRVRLPSVAVAANALLVAYKLEREGNAKEIVRMRVPLENLGNGLEEPKDPPKTSRELGDVQRVSEDKIGADAPAIACGQEGCFVVWHGEPGAYAAMIDPKEAKVIWRKRFSEKGGRPALAVNEGQVAVSFYEGGRIRMAFLSRDGVSPATSLLRLFDPTSPRPWLAPGGQKNEWLLAWQDSDVPRGSYEIYAARLMCR